MDRIMEVYYEEAGELLQSMENYLIRLEQETCDEDINGLFRCIHSIKGSSSMAGFSEIASLAHKVEDLLNFIREGKLAFDDKVFSLCFTSFDEIKKGIDMRRQGGQQGPSSLEKEIAMLLKDLEGLGAEKSLSYELKKGNEGIHYCNRYFARVIFEAGDPMPGVRRFLLYSLMGEVGRIGYSNPPIHRMIDMNSGEEIKIYECILETNLCEDDLHGQMNIDYVEEIQIVNISLKHLAEEKRNCGKNEVNFFYQLFFEKNHKDFSEKIYRNLLEKIYRFIRNKVLFKIILYENMEDIESLQKGLNSNQFKYLMLDIGQVALLEVSEVRKIIELKRGLKEKDIVLWLINGGAYKKRLYNIFDSIREMEDIKVWDTEIEAVLSQGGKFDETKL